MTTNEKLDKDRFRRDLGGEAEAYQEVARRLGLLPEGDANMVLDLDKHRQKRGGRPAASRRPAQLARRHRGSKRRSSAVHGERGEPWLPNFAQPDAPDAMKRPRRLRRGAPFGLSALLLKS